MLAIPGARAHIAPLSWMWTTQASSKIFWRKGIRSYRIGVFTTAKTGHAHVVYPLAHPVLEHPESNPAPLRYLRDIEKKLLAALDGDPAYSGALARNPLTKPQWQTQTLWFRQHPWGLAELDEAASVQLPPGWTPATAAPGGVGRNCEMFEGLMTWAGRPANRSGSLMVQAQGINSEFYLAASLP